MKRPEEALQRAVVTLLRAVCGPDVWWCAIPNGGYRTKAEAGIMVAMGQRAGAPDLLLVHAGRATFIELKAAKGDLSTAQKTTHPAIRAAGCPVYVCRSLDDVIAALHEAEVPTRARAAA